MIGRRSSELFLLLVVLTVTLCGLTFGTRWTHFKLSLLTQQALKRPFAIWTPVQVILPFSSADKTGSPACDAALAEINAIDPQRLSSESLHRLVRIGSLSCESDESSARRFQAENSVGLKPNGLDALYVGEALRRLGRYQDALALQKRVPEISFRYIEQGRIAIEQMHDERKAFAFFDLADEIDPSFDSRRAVMYRSRCLASLRDEGSEGASDPCVDLYRSIVDWLSSLLLGRSYYNQGRFDAAIPLLITSAALKPTSGETYYWLGKSWSAKGVLVEAEQAYQEGIVQAPDYPWNYLAMAEVLALQECYDSARVYLERMGVFGSQEVTTAIANAQRRLDGRSGNLASCN